MNGEGFEFFAPSLEKLQDELPQYQILRLLGQGGMGAVYKARHPKLDRLVAIKILAVGTGKDGKFAQRFLREAQTMAMLRHPRIVDVHDFGETPGGFDKS